MNDDTLVVGVGKTFVLEKLTAALHDGKATLPLLLCGPPGCGKKCLVQTASKAAGYDLTLYDVSAITFETKYYDKAAKKERSTDHSEVSKDLLEKVINKYGGYQERSLFTNTTTLLCVYGVRLRSRALERGGSSLYR